MSKKEREKKLAKLSEIEQEKQAAILRRNERMEPTIQLLKKFSFTIIATAVIIVIGLIINGHLDSIAARLGNR